MTLTSDAIQALIDDDTGSLSLKVTYNCGTPTTIAITTGDLTGSTYVLSFSSLGQSTRFQDGVYYLELSYLNDTAVSDTSIEYVSVTIPCQLINLYADKTIDCLSEKPCAENEYFWAAVFHDLLGQAGICSKFTYTNACSMWTTMNTILGTINDGDCGCS